jgi:alpha-1,6-mannosyltransferase
MFIGLWQEYAWLSVSGWGTSLATSSLRRIVDRLGIASCGAYLIMALLSYVYAPMLWTESFAPKANAFFISLFGAENLAAIGAVLSAPLVVLVARWLPILFVSAAACYLLLKLGRDRLKADDETADRILFWSFAFGGFCFFAHPVLTQDFWLSAVWGKMIVAGINPYYEKFTPEMIGAIPLDHFPMTMSYGPLWALIAGAVMTVAGSSLLVAALLFKAVLLAAWCATLYMVDKLVRQVAPNARALALVAVGWVPLGVVETVAEGHNDIGLVLPALLWLALLVARNRNAPIALAASALCKYTTGPLVLIDMLHNFRAQRVSLGRYIARGIPALILAILVMVVFFRSPAFFDGARLVDSWHFMLPSDAYLAITDAIGGWGEPLENAFLTIFPGIALYQLAVYWRHPDEEHLFRLTLATMCAVSFSLIGHIWSWYLVWTLPLAALTPNWWLSRFIVGLCLAIPFTAVAWWVPEAEDYTNVAALYLYVTATAWTIFSAAPEAESAEGMVPAPGPLIDFAKARDRILGRSAPMPVRVEPDFAHPVKAAASGEH